MAAVNGTKPPEPPTPDQLQPSDKISQHGISVAENTSSSGGGTGNTTTEAQAKTVVHTKVISPLNDLSKQSVNFESLVAKEEAKERTGQPSPQDQVVASQVDIGDIQPNNPSIQTIAPNQTPESDVAAPSTDPSAIAL